MEFFVNISALTSSFVKNYENSGNPKPLITHLHEAIDDNNLGGVKDLLDLGVKPNRASLMVALAKKPISIEIIVRLLCAGVQADNDHFNEAIQHRQPKEVLELLLLNGSEFSPADSFIVGTIYPEDVVNDLQKYLKK